MRRFSLFAAPIAILFATTALAAPANQPRQSPEWDRLEQAFDGKDYGKARQIAEALAGAGDPLAMNYLSVILANGLGGPADPDRAQRLLEKAAAASVLVAKLNLAVQLAAGGDKSQWPRAMSLLQEVAQDPKLASEVHYPLGRILLLG